jgi:hypothetical protein
VPDGGNLHRVKIVGANIHGTYGTANAILAIFGVVGWGLALIGLVVVFVGLGSGGPFGSVIAGIGIGIAALGLLQVAAQQMIRAAVDSADYARQGLILQIAMAEGRSDIDLRQLAPTRSQDGLSDIAGRGAPRGANAPPMAAGFSKGISNEARAAIQKMMTKYEVRLTEDKSAVIVSSGEWKTSFSSEAEIINFARVMK